MRKLLLDIEQWVRAHARSQRTRRIIEEKRQYAREYHDMHRYLRKLRAATQEHESIVQALQKRMGL